VFTIILTFAITIARYKVLVFDEKIIGRWPKCKRGSLSLGGWQ
jgi:hypothetical protein